MNCSKCDYGNRGDAVYCQYCGTLMRKQPPKILVLRPSQPAANNLRRYQLAGYYAGYAVCGLAGGGVLVVVAFLVFLFVCDCVGVIDPAGNSGALLALVALETGVMSVYGALVVRHIRARTSKARQHLPSYRRLPTAHC
jgi:hypothetical protein